MCVKNQLLEMLSPLVDITLPFGAEKEIITPRS